MAGSYKWPYPPRHGPHPARSLRARGSPLVITGRKIAGNRVGARPGRRGNVLAEAGNDHTGGQAHADDDAAISRALTFDTDAQRAGIEVSSGREPGRRAVWRWCWHPTSLPHCVPKPDQTGWPPMPG